MIPLALTQLVLGARVLARFRAPGSASVAPATQPLSAGLVSVVVPVLDEQERLASCLDGLLAQGPEVGEILVVDGGSRDRTRALVSVYAARDPRLRLVDATPIPTDWNGKAWQLHVGVQQATRAQWILTVDADVRPAPLLARSLVARACASGLDVLSVATRQRLSGPAEGLLHPALLTTLVYRFGPPGRSMRRVEQVQANGQCFLVRRSALVQSGGFAPARASRCEEVTVARAIVAAGGAVGFYEAGDLVSAEMYQGWRDAWRNWTRSLPMRDQYTRLASMLGLCEVTVVQALPLPLLAALWPVRRCSPGSVLAIMVNAALVAVRLGVLGGTLRAYRDAPWTYWLSPLCDVPAALGLWTSVARRRHTWRGRVLVRVRIHGGNV